MGFFYLAHLCFTSPPAIAPKLQPTTFSERVVYELLSTWAFSLSKSNGDTSVPAWRVPGVGPDLAEGLCTGVSIQHQTECGM